MDIHHGWNGYLQDDILTVMEDQGISILHHSHQWQVDIQARVWVENIHWYKPTQDRVYNVGQVLKSNYQERWRVKLSTVEVVLVLEITPCPLTNINRDGKDNLQDKVLNHELKYELLTAYLLFPLSSSRSLYLFSCL